MNIHFKDGKPFGNPRTKPANYELEYSKRLERWQSSSIAIKEPEFKVEDVVYDGVGNEYLLGAFDNQNSEIVFATRTDDKGKYPYIYNFDLNDISHYYENQEIDKGKFRLVRKVEYYRDNRNVGATSHLIAKRYSEWQEVKEPVEEIHFTETDYFGSDTNPEYTKFLKDKKKGLIVLEQFKF